jgi:hypothetical protein
MQKYTLVLMWGSQGIEWLLSPIYHLNTSWVCASEKGL